MRTLFLLSACLLMAACTGRSSQASNDDEAKPVITVTLEPQRYFTEAIAGDKFKVVSMVPKGSSPETYDPVPQQLVSLGDSKAYFRIGYIGFEQTWMDRLMNNTPHIQVFDTSKGIDLILNNDDHDHGHNSHDGHIHAVEPHVWNSTGNALIIAGNTYKALKKKFKLKKYVPCDQCHGTGAEGDGGSETCPTCKGSGSVIRNQQTILGTMQTRVTCSTCGGEGKIIKNKCKKCGGDGIIYGEEVVSVKIPAGVAEGMQLSMGGKGNAGKHNGVAGDLLILVEEEPHQDLIRDENDLIYNLLLSFPTAALGGAVEIPTIDGKVKVKIDSGTQPGKVLRLRGKGLPNVNGYGTGDLLVNISIYVPEALNKEEKSTLEKMEASDNFKPNTSVKEKIFKKFKSFFD